MALTSNELVFQVIDALEAAAIPYMLVGSYSSNYFGRSRSTKDADFVLQVTGDQLSDFAGKLGPHFKLDSQMTFESITMTSKHLIRCQSSPFTIELFMRSATTRTINCDSPDANASSWKDAVSGSRPVKTS